MSERPPQRGSVRRQRAVVLLGLVATVLALTTVVGALLRRSLPLVRLPAPPPPGEIDPYGPNPYIVRMRPFLYSHVPGSVYVQARAGYRVRYEINRRGFRGPEIASPKPPGSKRLVLIGDSMVEGHGCPFEETFGTRLGNRLARSGWEVVNAGVQGASPIYFAANLDRYLALEPDAVLIVIYENDIADDVNREREYANLPYLWGAGPGLADEARRPMLLAVPALLDLVTRASGVATPSAIERIIHRNRADRPSLDSVDVSGVSRATVSTSWFAGNWPMTERYLDLVLGTFEARRVPVLLAVLAVGSLPGGPKPVKLEYLGELEASVREKARHAGLPFFSLLPVLTKALADKPVEQTVIVDDGHLTPEAHGALALALEPWLRQSLPATDPRR